MVQNKNNSIDVRSRREVQRVLVFDANSLVHRAFHAMPPLSTPKGVMINAVYGFFLVFFKVVKEFSPQYIAVTFDSAGPTLRKEKFSAYKEGRVKGPEELYAQIPLIKEALQDLGVSIYEKQGYEADDYIGTIVAWVKKQKEGSQLESIIVSGDQDTFQLVDEKTKVYTMRKGMQDTVLYDAEAVKEKFGGLTPDQIVDFKALRGDPSDNIPGVEGVGEKTAVDLLRMYGSLENLYMSIEKDAHKKDAIKPRTITLLREQKKQAFLSQDLATIQCDAPITLRMEDLRWTADVRSIRSSLEKFGMKTLIQRLENQYGTVVEEVKEEAEQHIELLYKEGVLSKQVYDLEKKLLPVIAAMEERGIKINRQYFKELEKELEQELKIIEGRVYELAKREFNINSPQQLAEVLFQDLGVSSVGIKKTPKGAISTAAEELEKLQDRHPIGKEILYYRELQKLYTTYVKPLPKFADPRGRLHTHFDSFGAATGRLSSTEPALQNIPVQGRWGRRIREGFIPEKGKIFYGFDYSQMELRIAAHMTGDKTMQQTFLEGQDIHATTAATVFGVEHEKVDTEMRSRAKALNFGILYGMGARGFSSAAHIPYGDAVSFIQEYFLRFPGIKEYIDKTILFAQENGYVETLLGRRRYIPGINSTAPRMKAAAERIAINHPIQGTAADIIKTAMVHIAADILSRQDEIHMVLQIHDELVFEGKDSDLSTQESFIVEKMEGAASLSVPMEIDVAKGDNWAKLKK